MSSPTRVLLADDDAMVRRLLVTMITGEEFQVVAEAADGHEAVEKARSTRPDIVLLDLHMPRLAGIEAAPLIRAASPDTRILVLTMTDDEEYVLRMVRAGASGYVVKDRAVSDLVPALRALRAGRDFFGPKGAPGPAAGAS